MTMSILDALREKQQRVVELRKELAQLEAELRDAKALLSGRPLASKYNAHKPKSRHGFTNGVRRKPIQENSSVWWAQQALMLEEKPLHIDELLQKIKEYSTLDVKKSTLISNLSRYIKHNDTFVRPAESTYGLINYAEKTK